MKSVQISAGPCQFVVLFFLLATQLRKWSILAAGFFSWQPIAPFALLTAEQMSCRGGRLLFYDATTSISHPKHHIKNKFWLHDSSQHFLALRTAAPEQINYLVGM